MQTAESLIRWDRGDWLPVAKAHRSPRTVAQVAAGRALGLSRFLLPYYGSARGESPQIRRIDRPVGTLTTHDRYGIVDGDRMRMLSVDECRRAMGFPDGTILPINRPAAMKMLGNAIVPNVGADLIRAVLAVA